MEKLFMNSSQPLHCSQHAHHPKGVPSSWTCVSMAGSYLVTIYLGMPSFYLSWKVTFLITCWLALPFNTMNAILVSLYFRCFQWEPSTRWAFLLLALHFSCFCFSTIWHRCACMWLSFFYAGSAKFLLCHSWNQGYFHPLSFKYFCFFPQLPLLELSLYVHWCIWKKNIAS